MSWDELLTVRKSANDLNVSHWTIRAWLSTGRLQRTKVGRRTMIRRSEIERFLQEEARRYAAKNQHGENS
jgi:excisionase family DNA binding protein